jgi:hypothetical protein
MSAPRGTPSRLPAVRERLIGLHKTLLDEQSRAYEAMHGREVSGNELFQLLLHDEHFAWLRPLSGLISEIDAALDAEEGPPPAVRDEHFLARTRGLLRSEREGLFETRYRDALQRSPDVVIAHAAVVKLL